MFNKNFLRLFNTTTLGLFFGYCLGFAILFLFNLVADTDLLSLSVKGYAYCKLLIMLLCSTFGIILTKNFSSEIALSIPFVQFNLKNKQSNVKELILDFSSLSDGRIIDVCQTHIFDNRLVCPRFLIKELIQQKEIHEKAKNALENLAQLETMPDLNLRFEETDFPDVKETQGKTLKLARLLQCDLLTADMSRVQIAGIEDVKIINLNMLAQSLKPHMQKGESLKIQVQRYGKEENQGVGYLEDGTMVVVNGGAEFLGETIVARVVSIKHTSSGRMIFCNAAVDALQV